MSYVGEDRDRALTLMRSLSREQAVADMSASIPPEAVATVKAAMAHARSLEFLATLF